MKKWTIEDSRELYNINGWGTSYFGINDRGDVYVTPCKNDTQIDLRDVMDELALRDVTPPVLLRFPDILDNRIEKTSSCFKKGFCSLKMGVAATSTTITWPVAKPRFTSTCRSQPLPLRSSYTGILKDGSILRMVRMISSANSSSIRQRSTGTMAWLPGW